MPFVVIDLFSQGRAVQRHVQGWAKEDVLAWLRHWGTLEGWQYLDFPVTYAFRAWCGTVTHFSLEGGVFTFYGDHCVALPPE